MLIRHHRRFGRNG